MLYDLISHLNEVSFWDNLSSTLHVLARVVEVRHEIEALTLNSLEMYSF